MKKQVFNDFELFTIKNALLKYSDYFMSAGNYESASQIIEVFDKVQRVASK